VHAQLDEPAALLLGDLQAAMHRDEMRETQIPREAVGAAEGRGSTRTLA
jgi:hypothetical protein